MNLKNCRLSINRNINSNSNDEMSVEITDRDSGARFFAGRMSLESFMRALTGQAEIQFDEALVRGLEKLGMRQEVKRERVEIPSDADRYYGDKFAPAHAAWAAPFEVDGWKADTDRAYNGHRVTYEKGRPAFYETTFRRWVPMDEVKP